MHWAASNSIGRTCRFSCFRPMTIQPTLRRAVALGASGFLLKGATRDKLIEAIHTAAAGQSAWTRDELRRVTGALATPRLAADVEVPLTQRESEVLRQLAYGLTNKEIALALHISYETVKEHVQHILRQDRRI